MPTPAEFKLWDYAAQQSGLVSRRQALAVGLTRHQIARRIGDGRWKRVKAGVYLMVGFPVTEVSQLAAACAALGAAVSHESAARLHEFTYVRPSPPTVTVGLRTTNRFEAVRVHQLTDLTSEHVTEIGLLPVTTPARTIVDLAAVTHLERLRIVVERALAEDRVAFDELVQLFQSLARRGKPGTVRLREILDERSTRFVATESVLEDLFLRKVREWGLPEPVLQYPLPWRHPREKRVDFAFPWARLLVETDGRAWHTTVEAFDSDRMRGNHAQIAGWRLLRITYRMLVQEPETVRRLLEAALAMHQAS